MCRGCETILCDPEDIPFNPSQPPPNACGDTIGPVDFLCTHSDPVHCFNPPTIPDNLGPFCTGGFSTGSLTGDYGNGVGDSTPGALRDCKDPVPHHCERYTSPEDFGYCDEAAEKRVEFWINFFGCGTGSEPSSSYSCVGSNGICVEVGGVGQMCTACSGDSCVQWTQRRLGDPRVMQDAVKNGGGGATTEEDNSSIEAEDNTGVTPTPSTAPTAPPLEQLIILDPLFLTIVPTSAANAVEAAKLEGEEVAAGEKKKPDPDSAQAKEEPSEGSDPVVFESGELVMHPVHVSLPGPVKDFAFRRS